MKHEHVWRIKARTLKERGIYTYLECDCGQECWLFAEFTQLLGDVMDLEIKRAEIVSRSRRSPEEIATSD